MNLTRKQIEESPSIDTHKPVSRQYEEEYYQYYGWPSYWLGNLMQGISLSAAAPATRRFQIEETDDGSHAADLIFLEVRRNPDLLRHKREQVLTSLDVRSGFDRFLGDPA